MKNIIKSTFIILVIIIAVSCRPSSNESIDPGKGLVLNRNGVEKVYLSMADFPWDSLQAGDIVQISYRAEPYREKIVISAVGAKDKPIRIVGIPGPNGELPIIDGENANTKSGQHIAGGTPNDLNTRSLICIANRPNKGSNWGLQPKFISIENLEIRNAHQDYQYTVDGGSPRNYDDFTAAIWVDRVTNFTLKNCVIHHSSTGLFINSRDFQEPNHADISSDILIEGCSFYENGMVGSYLEHNTYVEAINVTYQYNKYLPLKKGALGSTLKDRSSNTVVRYNWLEGSQRVLDLVEAEESASYTTKDSKYKETYVYGNVMFNGSQGATSPIHYGGDKYDYKKYRRGTLYFYNNTFINESDQASDPSKGRYYTNLFQLPDATETAGLPVEEIVDFRNNIIYNTSENAGKNASDFYLLTKTGNIKIGKNWISPNFNIGQTGFTGTATGRANLIIGDAGGTNNPEFVNYKGHDFTLTSKSNAIDKGEVLVAPISTTNPLLLQYVLHQTFKNRPMIGTAFDLGAFENGN